MSQDMITGYPDTEQVETRVSLQYTLPMSPNPLTLTPLVPFVIMNPRVISWAIECAILSDPDHPVLFKWPRPNSPPLNLFDTAPETKPYVTEAVTVKDLNRLFVARDTPDPHAPDLLVYFRVEVDVFRFFQLMLNYLTRDAADLSTIANPPEADQRKLMGSFTLNELPGGHLAITHHSASPSYRFNSIPATLTNRTISPPAQPGGKPIVTLEFEIAVASLAPAFRDEVAEVLVAADYSHLYVIEKEKLARAHGGLAQFNHGWNEISAQLSQNVLNYLLHKIDRLRGPRIFAALFTRVIEVCTHSLT